MKPQRHKRADRADESLCSKYCAVHGSPDPAGRSWRNSLLTGSQLFLRVPEVLRPRAVTAVTLQEHPRGPTHRQSQKTIPNLERTPWRGLASAIVALSLKTSFPFNFKFVFCL